MAIDTFAASPSSRCTSTIVSRQSSSPCRGTRTYCFRAPLLQNDLITINVRIHQFRYDILPQLSQKSLGGKILIELLDPFRDFRRFRFGKESTDRRSDCSGGRDDWVFRIGVRFAEGGEEVRDGFWGEVSEAGSFRFVCCGVERDGSSGAVIISSAIRNKR